MWLTVVSKDEKGNEKYFDLPSRLLQDRIILVAEEINDNTAMSIVAQLLYLESENPDQEIYMYINSPGGSISAGMAIYDVMNKISCPIVTIATGMAASMGAFLLSCGSKGKRYALPNSTIMIHQPLGGAQGQATDIEIHARRIIRIREKMYDIMAKNSGKPVEEIASACERDNYLEPEEALKMGLIDEIIDCTPKAY